MAPPASCCAESLALTSQAMLRGDERERRVCTGWVPSTSEIDFINLRQENIYRGCAGVYIREGVSINNVNFYGGSILGMVGEKNSSVYGCYFSSNITNINSIDIVLTINA